MKNVKKILVLVALLLSGLTAHALDDGSLDASFNGYGFSDLLPSDSTIKAIAIQCDGKIVVAGSSDLNGKDGFLVARFKADGSLDRSFGSNGLVITKFGANESASSAHALVLQDDGKIVAAGFTNAIKGSSRWCLARYNADGSIDESFFGGRAIFKGTVITFFGGDSRSCANALALTVDGKIIAAGSSHTDPDKTYFALARYNTDGSLDSSFNAQGKGSTAGTVRTTFGGNTDDDQAFAVAIQPNGKIVAGGYSMLTGAKTFALARYNTDGSLDTTFFNPLYARYQGTVVTNFAAGETDGMIRALIIQADGKIVAAGSSNSNSPRKEISHFALARYDNRGLLDPDFGGQGLARVPGTIISSFGAHEGASTINTLALQSDGKIVAGGTLSRDGRAYFALARYKSDGTVDPDFNDDDSYSPCGKVITWVGGRKLNEVFALAIQANGNIVAGGCTDRNGSPQGVLARYVSHKPLGEPSIQSPIDKSVIINGCAIQVQGSSANPSLLKILVDNEPVGTVLTRGNSNLWQYQLPPLCNGSHTVQVLEHCANGRINFISDLITFLVDQTPHPVNAIVNTCGLNPISGTLQASGASGKYSFAIGSVKNGTVTLVDNQYTFNPSIAVGQGEFNFIVTDSVTHVSKQGTVSVIINEIPGAISCQFYSCPNTPSSGSLEQYVSGGSAPFSFAATGAAYNGSVIVNSDGTFTFTPEQGFSGSASFQYQVTDSKGCVSEPQTVNITVYQAPVVHDALFTTHELEAISENLSAYVTGGTAPYQFNLVGCPSNAAITLQENGKLKLIPMKGFSGTAHCKFNVADAHGCISNTAHIIVTVYEVPVAKDGAASTCENALMHHSLLDLVNKGTAPYTFEQVDGATNGTAIISADGSYSFMPALNFFGSASFKYRVTDGNNGVSNTAVVTITVNELPKVNDGQFSVCQDVTLHNNLTSLVSGGSGVNTFNLITQPVHGSVVVNADGTFEYVPAPQFNGVDSFSFNVVDSNGCQSLTAAVSITVFESPKVQDGQIITSANRPDTADLSKLVSQGTPEYTYFIDNSWHGTVVLSAEGTVHFTPDQDFDGVAGFDYHVVDSHNCSSAVAHVSVIVHPAPSLADASFTIFQDTVLHGDVRNLARGGIAPYSFSITKQPDLGEVTFNDDGSFLYTCAPGVFGTQIFEFAMRDANGSVSNTGHVTITIWELPKLQDLSLETVSNVTLTANLTASVTGGLPPYSFALVGDAVNGTAVVNADGSFNFQGAPDFVGAASFQYSVIDARNGASACATVSITVHSSVSIVQSTSLELCQESSISGDLSSTASGSVAPYEFSIVAQPSKGSLTLASNGIFHYAPHAHEYGQDSFTYEVSDALHASKAQSTVHITINQKPHALDTVVQTFMNESVSGQLLPLIVNGLAPYEFTQVDAASQGSVVINPDGTYTFTADQGFLGTAQFWYAVRDARGCLSNSAMVTINVYELPKTESADFITVMNKAVQGSLQALIKGGTPPYEFSAVESANGTVQIDPDGSFNFTPAYDYVGQASFSYAIADAHQGKSLGSVAITILNALASNTGSFSICQGSQLQADLSAGISGGLPAYHFSLIDASVAQSVSVSPEGLLTFVPLHDFSGSAWITYQVLDAQNNMLHSTIEIVVRQAPHAADKTIHICEYASVKDTLADLVTGGTPDYTFTALSSTQGNLKINPDGSYIFVPSVGFTGSTQFTYQVCDAHGCTSNIGTLTIVITAAPVAQGTTLVTDEDAPLTASLVPLMNGGVEPYQFEIIGAPSNGQLALANDGTVNFAADAGFNGVTSFQFKATDANNCTSNIATVTVVVNPVSRISRGKIKRYLNFGA